MQQHHQHPAHAPSHSHSHSHPHPHDDVEPQHAVRFYVSHVELYDAVANFLAPAMLTGRPIVVIARPENRAGFEATLQQRGVDVDAAVSCGDAVFLDARETLTAFLVDGVPHAGLFRETIFPVLASFGGRCVAAYGEMVDILWKEGRPAQAIQLEEMWSNLQKEISFQLLCAYEQPADGVPRSVCDAHDVVEVPAGHEETIIAELSHRKRVERELRRTLVELRHAERQLSDFVENAPFALHSIAADGTVVWANNAELRLLGYENHKDEYFGRNIREAHVDGAVVDDILARLAGGEELLDYPAAMRARDGSVRHVLITSNAMVRDGKIESTRCVMRDVTEVLLAAEDNNRSRMRADLISRVAGAANRASRVDDVFDACLEAMIALGTERCSILALDSSGVMRFRAWRGVSETYRRDIEGHNPWAADSTSGTGATGATGAFEPIIVTDIGRDPRLGAFADIFHREAMASLALIPLVAGGRLVGKFTLGWTTPYQLSPQDLATAVAIASHVAAALVRFKVLDDLQETVHFNEVFTGILAHDLRNPLHSIILSARSIEVRLPDAVGPAQRIARSGERMSRMIDQLLDFTRVRLGGGIPVRRERADLLSVLRRILEEHASDVSRIELSHHGDTCGHWDEDRLAQVFSNLMGNALQHGAATAEQPITIAVVGEEHGVRAEISNRGVIPPGLLGTLFEPLSGAPKNHAGSRGLGLGLFITRQIIQAHQGHIDVASDDATGTQFRMWLPRNL